MTGNLLLNRHTNQGQTQSSVDSELGLMWQLDKQAMVHSVVSLIFTVLALPVCCQICTIKDAITQWNLNIF